MINDSARPENKTQLLFLLCIILFSKIVLGLFYDFSHPIRKQVHAEVSHLIISCTILFAVFLKKHCHTRSSIIIII